MSIGKMKVVEWSQSQGRFHIDGLKHTLERNLDAFKKNRQRDYIPLMITDTREEADRFVDELEPYREGRPNQLEDELQAMVRPPVAARSIGDFAKPNYDAEIRNHADHVELLIYGKNDGYVIEHNKMNTPEKCLCWAYHMSKKLNVTPRHIRAFLEAAKELGVEIMTPADTL